MTPNNIDLKDKYVLVQATVLFQNPSYYSGDIVEENDHLTFWSAKNRYPIVTGVAIKFHKFIAELYNELNNNNKRCEWQ